MTYNCFLNEMADILDPLIKEAGLGQARRENQHFLQYTNIAHFTNSEKKGTRISLGVYLQNLHQGDSELKRYFDGLLPTPNNLMLGQSPVEFVRESGRDYEYNVTLAGRALCLLKVGKGRNEEGQARKAFEIEIDSIAWAEREHFTDEDRQLIRDCYRFILSLMPQNPQERARLFGERTGQHGNTGRGNPMAAGNPDGDAKEDDDGAGNQNERENLMRNKIVFGAPGTGKSYQLNEEAKKSFAEVNSERVTFYATYSYAQFVGTYKPVMKDVEGREKISYEFVPGPFLRMLVNALKNPNEKFLLIIEEINRANAAAVFGDVFQLLDRGVDGVSEYSIAASEDVKKYLENVLTEGGKQALVKLSGSVDKLKIPANLYLWATMNSADQGVFPLDTAFKRRWSFEYIGIDDGEPKAPDLKIQIKNQTYDWKLLRKFLNRLLILNGVNEDKLMGPFFLKNTSEFNSKVLMYLWEDAARMCRRAVFGEIKTYSDLCDEWEKKGVDIFEVAKFNDDELKGCLASLLPAGNTPPKDGVAPAQETNND